MLFCASVRFNSDLFNASTDEAILGVIKVKGVENMLERRREAAGEQSAYDLRDWVGGTRGVDCGDDKRFAIIVC